MSSWLTFVFHFICEARSAEWRLIHNGRLKAEGMTDYLGWRNLQVFVELEFKNTVLWRESVWNNVEELLLNLPDHVPPGLTPWLGYCRNCRVFSLRAGNLVGLSCAQGPWELPTAAQWKLLSSLLLLTTKLIAASISLSCCRVLGASDLWKSPLFFIGQLLDRASDLEFLLLAVCECIWLLSLIPGNQGDLVHHPVRFCF